MQVKFVLVRGVRVVFLRTSWAFAIVWVLTSPAFAQRLSGTVVPDHYTLWFAPDFQKDNFRGRATIEVQLKEPARAITLHAAELTFQAVRIASGGRTQDARVGLDQKAETGNLNVPPAIPAGPATSEAPAPP